MSEGENGPPRAIWGSFCQAVGAELREKTTIAGATGLEHRVQGIGVDEAGKRLVVISAEANARVAALMQVDVQATNPDFKVVVARPVIFDIGVLARRLFTNTPPKVPIAQVVEWSNRAKTMSQEERIGFYGKYFSEVIDPVVRGYKNAKLPTITQVLDLVSQGSQLDWAAIRARINSDGEYVDFSSIYNIDNTIIDRQHGVCAVPLFEFSESDWELFQAGSDIDEIRGRLKQLDVYQYFYPSPDQVALAVAEQGGRNEAAVIEAIAMSPGLGHPLGSSELVTLKDFRDSVAALKDCGHLVDGEYGVEVTPQGASVRASSKVRPKEGFMTKLLSRLNINLSASPSDFIPKP